MESMQRSWNILHIDDDEDDFVLTRSMLAQAQSSKISLEWASSPDEAGEKMYANRYDAVLVDYDLGASTGIELIRGMVAEGIYPPGVIFRPEVYEVVVKWWKKFNYPFCNETYVKRVEEELEINLPDLDV